MEDDDDEVNTVLQPQQGWQLNELRCQGVRQNQNKVTPPSKQQCGSGKKLEKKKSGIPDLDSIKQSLSFENLGAESVGEDSKADSKSSAGDDPVVKSSHWIIKLDLMKTLEGCKLGVWEHHAEETLLKLPASAPAAVALKSHLKKYRKCRDLSPHNVASKTHGEIQSALAELEGVITSWPTQLQLTLWQKSCSALVARALELQTHEALEELLACARPFSPVEGAAVEKLDIGNPKLMSLEVEVPKKRALFLQVFLQDILMKQVLRGEGSKAWLEWICPRLEENCNQALLIIDLDDAYASALAEVKWAVRGLQGLLASEVTKKMAYILEVAKIRDGLKQSGTDCFATFSKAVDQSEYYSQLLKTFVKVTSSLNMQKEKIEEMQDFLQQTTFEVDNIGQETIIQGIKDMAFLKAATPEGSMDGMAKQLEDGCKAYWQSYCKKLNENGLAAEKMMDHVGDFLMETSICFPMEGSWGEAKALLASQVKDLAAKGKTVGMLEAVENSEKMLLENGEVTQEFGTETIQKISMAHGWPLEKGQQEELQKHYELFIDFLEKELNAGTRASSTWDVADALKEWVAAKPGLAKVVPSAVSLMDGICKLEQGRASIDEIMKDNHSQQHLTSLMRSISLVKGSAEERDKTLWAAPFFQKQLPYAEKLVESAFTWKSQVVQRTWVEASLKLKASMGTTEWNKNLAGTAPWAQVVEAAKGTVLEQDGGEAQISYQCWCRGNLW